MVNHPLALIVYNRPRHLGRVLEALEPLKPEPLFVFSDGWKGGEDRLKVEAVRMLISNIRWTQPILRLNHDHLGMRKSIVSAVDEVLTHHRTIVVLEDDCVPGRFFLDFAGRCLDLYRDVPKVMSVGGYTIPLSSELLQDYPWDAYFFPRVESWGWATWRRAWDHYVRDLGAGLNQAYRGKINLTCGGGDVPRMLIKARRGELDAWTPGWLLATLINQAYTIYPTRSHIDNIGFDGSGVHCKSKVKFSELIKATSPSLRFPPRPELDLGICDRVRKFYDTL